MKLRKNIELISLSGLMLLMIACSPIDKTASHSEESLEMNQTKRYSKEENVAPTKQHNEQNILSEPAPTNEKKESNQLKIQIGDDSFTVTLANNSSVEALKEYLANGPVTLYLQDYAKMEKVGDLGTTLPQNNEQMNTSAGDIVLYQGRQFVIYYGSNSWSLTPLGKIEDISTNELKEILGHDDVEVTLSLP